MQIGVAGRSGHNARATANIQFLVLVNASGLVLKLEEKQEITIVMIMAVVILLKLKIVVLMSAYVRVRNYSKLIHQFSVISFRMVIMGQMVKLYKNM